MPHARRSIVLSRICLVLFVLTGYLASAPLQQARAAALVVTKAEDTNDGACDSDCSLREAIAAAAEGDTITFNGNYTIVLGSELTIANNLTISGINHTITLSGNDTVRIINITSGSVTLDHLNLINGQATPEECYINGVDHCGGAIYADITSLNLVIKNSTFRNNSAGYSTSGPTGLALGGVIAFYGYSMSIENSTFTGNKSGWLGGVMDTMGYSVSIQNSTFVDNVANGYGGAINTVSNTLSLYNNTFANNSASSSGGAIFNGGTTSVTGSDNLFFHNTSYFNNACGGNSAVTLDATNISDNGNCGGKISTSIYLGTLGDYGGYTQTIPLLPGSAGIDAGSGCLTTDQRGKNRVGACDVGSFESQGFVLAYKSGDGQSTPVSTAFDNPLEITVSANAAGEPVDGGKITFTAPASGSSATFASNPASISGGVASITASANNIIGGPYTVSASALGGSGTPNYSLTNLVPELSINDIQSAEGNSGTTNFSFTVTLNGASSTPATVDYATSDVTAVAGSDYSANTGTLTFAPGETTKTVSIQVSGDSSVEPDETFVVGIYNATNATISDNQGQGSITNDDTAGVTVNPTTGLTTSEAGVSTSLTVVLNSEPSANVTIDLSSSDTGEGTVLPASLTFTAANWSTPQTVTITGVDDVFADGAQPYTIMTASAVSSDLDYSGLDVADVAVTNTDDDTAGVTVNPTSGLITTEAGGTATFTVVLNSKALENVMIPLLSSDSSEGTVSPDSLLFTPLIWNVPQTVTVTGVDDAVADGDTAYTIAIGTITSTGPEYANMDPTDVSVTNIDNEAAAANVTITIRDASNTVVSTAAEGDLLHASATAVGNGTLVPTGNVTFSYFNNVTCAGTAAGTGTVALDGAGLADMTSSTALTADGLSFTAHYAGDGTYPAADSACVSISSSQYPTVLVTSVHTIPADFANLATGISTIQLQFNRDVMHDSNGNPNSVTYPANYLLVERGPNGILDTLSCLEGVGGDDRQLTVNTVSYDPATYRATVHVNNGVQLTDGIYRLYVCGTTSIYSTDGSTALNNHASDSTIIFIVGTGISSGGSTGTNKSVATGFTPGIVTTLPEQPAGLAYSPSELWIEIPALGIKQSIVGVPQTENGWDVSWLGNDVGYLQGTAFPTWAGNSVLTGHVTGADGLPGVFADLGKLKWGDEIIVHAFGQIYIYQVRTVDLSASPDTSKVVDKHEDLPWLTLITCRGYDEKTNTYRYRTVVRAVQVSVEEE